MINLPVISHGAHSLHYGAGQYDVTRRGRIWSDVDESPLMLLQTSYLYIYLSHYLCTYVVDNPYVCRYPTDLSSGVYPNTIQCKHCLSMYVDDESYQ